LERTILWLKKKTYVPMPKEERLKAKQDRSLDCYLCGKQLEEDGVADHDHFTGKYRGRAHNKCNLDYNLKKTMTPIFFHNLKGYDSHLIINAFTKYAIGRRIQVVPQSTEKYLSFSIGTLSFVDSFAFMNASLDSLAKTLPKDKFICTDEEFKDKSEMMKRKGVYPYEYMDSFEKFNETSLPPIEAFESKLTKKGITIEDYEYAQTVWKAMNIKNMGEWHDLYLKTDVLILTDVFENFRNVCHNYYKLDPACYLSAPGLAWDAVFKMTGAIIENITDVDMYLRIESGLRGGMCSVGAERLAEANNKYIKGYSESALQTFIEYFDANNLYGDAMIRPLPTGNYKWENAKNFDSKFITNYDFENEPKGYYFTVDLEYPKSLHDLHNDYPLAPVH